MTKRTIMILEFPDSTRSYKEEKRDEEKNFQNENLFQQQSASSPGMIIRHWHF